MSFPFHLHWAQSPCCLLHGALLDSLAGRDCVLSWRMIIPGTLIWPSLCLRGCLSVGLSLSPWGRPLPTSTPAQNLHEARPVAVSPTSSRLPCAGPVMLGLLRAGRGSAFCWLQALRLSESANPSQGLEWAQHFSERSGRVWGRKSEALLVTGAWAGRPEAPGTTHMVRRAWGPPQVAHLPSSHCPVFLLFLEQ